MRVATNVFSAGQETTVRLLSSALKVLAERSDIQQLLRRERDRIPNFIEETLRIESPVKGDFRLSRVPTSRWPRCHPPGAHPRPRPNTGLHRPRSDRTTDIRSPRTSTARPIDRHYQYVPTFILRG